MEDDDDEFLKWRYNPEQPIIKTPDSKNLMGNRETLLKLASFTLDAQ